MQSVLADSSALKALDYQVTYTILRKFKRTNIGGRDYWVQQSWHALVDIHIRDGDRKDFIWLEAQRPGHNGDGKEVGRSSEPDADGNGRVDRDNKPGNEPTEVSKDGQEAVRTEVYPSPEKAKEKGAVPDMRPKK